jgi:hypothetical protein
MYFNTKNIISASPFLLKKIIKKWDKIKKNTTERKEKGEKSKESENSSKSKGKRKPNGKKSRGLDSNQDVLS